MAFRLRPFVTVPDSLRTWTKWIGEAIQGSVGTTEIDDGAVTLPKLADIDTARVLGRVTAGTGEVESLTATQGRSVLGLGTAATQNTGTSGAVVPLLDAANTHASAKCTLFAVGSATPQGTEAANADTSGATLGQLETEVNQLKATLRNFGFITP